jgi:hypothetical protein
MSLKPWLSKASTIQDSKYLLGQRYAVAKPVRRTYKTQNGITIHILVHWKF